MGYTPKHAKPISLSGTGRNTSTAANRRYALSALSGPRGRHAAPMSAVRPGDTTAAPELRSA